jgi:hypothetical protein
MSALRTHEVGDNELKRESIARALLTLRSDEHHGAGEYHDGAVILDDDRALIEGFG